ncbi:MAG TPA: VOC family protein [Acidimicrobiales bacterium]|nr:VOC family protein [Acidimicrobiales bacterium]
MALRIGSTVINCSDIESMTDFWSGALDLVPSRRQPGDDFRVLRGPTVNLSLQVAITPVVARHQMHLDLYTDDLPAEEARLVALGARFVRRHEGDGYVVLLDPEDNEFCICHVSGASS